jgi:hypothetical protein
MSGVFAQVRHISPLTANREFFATREITLKEIVYRCMAQKLDASGFILIALEPGHQPPVELERLECFEL